MGRDATPLRIIVGFYNSRDVDALREGIRAYNQRMAEEGGPGRPLAIASMVQDAQRLYDDVVHLDGDLVLLDPRISGYYNTLINDLLMYEKRPVPVIGWVLPRTDSGRMMRNNGAKGVIQLPMDEQGVAHFIRSAEATVNAAWRARAEGRETYPGATYATGGDASYERRVIAVWVPKGGGSTRTTIAVNLAVALSHHRLGGRPTCLVDLDMTKGDCHTFLGYSIDLDAALSHGMQYVEHGLLRLMALSSAEVGRRGVNALDALKLDKVKQLWRPGEAQLTLIPGLLSPAEATAEEFSVVNYPTIHRLTRRLLTLLRQQATFVVCDLGQDFTRPLHHATLMDADEVIVPVPPQRTAILDAAYALPALEQSVGSLDKFKLVITAYDPAFGITEREIQDIVGLPRIATLPHDSHVATRALNAAEPFVLSDSDGPLGSAILALARIYYPGLGTVRAKRQPLKALAGLFVREV